jgi:hypothetical protein
MMSAQIFFSRNEFVVDVRFPVPLAPQALIWSPTHTGHSHKDTGDFSDDPFDEMGVSLSDICIPADSGKSSRAARSRCGW